MSSPTLDQREMLAVAAFIQSSPDLWSSLKEAANTQGKIEALKGHLVNLKTQEEAARKELQAEYRRQMDKRFADVHWARALAGAPCPHRVVFAGIAAYTIQAPTAARAHEVRSYLQKQADPATTEAERVVLEWGTGVQLLAESGEGKALPAISWVDLAPAELLVRLRGLPEVVIAKLADECLSMQTWLAGKLEENLGNC
ncbi:MAG TPA: hypothetical protein VLH09_09560 [Bryobacteraceae bacterium]|nr:hypothetical protein [Bryobacteraceae bacterium]